MTRSAFLPIRYDRRSIALHWITAGLVMSLWLLGQTIDWFPKGSPRSTARSTHIVLGLALALVLIPDHADGQFPEPVAAGPLQICARGEGERPSSGRWAAFHAGLVRAS